MDLRKKAIRLAYENPDIRDDLLSLLKKAAVVRHELFISVGNLNLQDFLKDVQRYMGRDWKVDVGYTVGDQKLLYLEPTTSSDWIGLAIQTALDSRKIFDLPKKFKSEFDGVLRLQRNLNKNKEFIKAMRSPEAQPAIQKARQRWANFDPEILGAESDGPLKNEADEDSYMGPNFSAQIFRELSDRQEAGQLADGKSIIEQRDPQPGRKGIKASGRYSSVAFLPVKTRAGVAKPGDILLSENSVAGAVIIRMEYSDKYGPDSKISGRAWDYEKGKWANYSGRWVWGRQVTSIEKGRKPSNKMESVLRHSIENWESKSASIRTAAIKLAYEKPELRDDLLPLIQKMAGTNKSAGTTKVSHDAMLKREGLTKAKVNAGEAYMFYLIDSEKNNSKFYEILVTENPKGSGAYDVKRRWGALTDSGTGGRVDGAKFDTDPRFSGLSYQEALKEAAKHAKKRLSKKPAYISAFGPKHKNPNTGKKLPMGQYPIGLVRTGPGFGWGTQAVTSCIPGLRSLQEAIDRAISEAIDRDTADLINALQEADVLVSRQIERADSTMAAKIKKYIRGPMMRAKGAPRFLPDSDGTKITKELRTLSRYLTKQLSYCG